MHTSTLKQLIATTLLHPLVVDVPHRISIKINFLSSSVQCACAMCLHLQAKKERIKTFWVHKLRKTVLVRQVIILASGSSSFTSTVRKFFFFIHTRETPSSYYSRSERLKWKNFFKDISVKYALYGALVDAATTECIMHISHAYLHNKGNIKQLCILFNFCGDRLDEHFCNFI